MALMVDEAAANVEAPAVGVVNIDFEVEGLDSRFAARRFHRIEDVTADSGVAPIRSHEQLVDERIAAAIFETEAAAQDTIAHRLAPDSRQPDRAVERFAPELGECAPQDRFVERKPLPRVELPHERQQILEVVRCRGFDADILLGGYEHDVRLTLHAVESGALLG